MRESCCTEVYYQAFPCLRIVQPGEFSIGPHFDVAYGHHPCSVNGYVFLTEPHGGFVGGSGLVGSGDEAPASSLFLESSPGGWHSLFGEHQQAESGNSSYTQLFAWTTGDLTEQTRVTLYFRIIDGSVFKRLSDGGYEEGGQKDVFRATPGYYHKCVRNEHGDFDSPRHLSRWW